MSTLPLGKNGYTLTHSHDHTHINKLRRDAARADPRVNVHR